LKVKFVVFYLECHWNCHRFSLDLSAWFVGIFLLYLARYSFKECNRVHIKSYM